MSGWPTDEQALTALQHRLAEEAAHARRDQPAALPARPLIGGCFVAFARGEAGPGHPGDRAWAAAVTWRSTGGEPRDEGAALRGARPDRGPREAADTDEQVVVAEEVPASYRPGLLAMREGAILEQALLRLTDRPDVVLVDATGLDHPRRAGLAIHLGRAVDLPTVGITHRPLHAPGDPPAALHRRGDHVPITVDGEVVAAWIVTRDATRPLVAHAGWRTTVDQAVDLALAASTPAARTPVPLGEARRVAREARSIASGVWG